VKPPLQATPEGANPLIVTVPPALLKSYPAVLGCTHVAVVGCEVGGSGVGSDVVGSGVVGGGVGCCVAAQPETVYGVPATVQFWYKTVPA